MTNAGQRPNVPGLLALGGLIVVFAFILVSASELSPTWLVLIVGGLGFVALTFLSRQPEAVLFSCYIATVSIELTKGLVAEGGVYTPALYLSLSDIFLLPLLLIQAVKQVLLRQPLRRPNPVVLAALAWLLWQWLRVLGAPMPLGSAMTAVNQTKYFLALWLVSTYLREPAHWRLMFRALGVAVGLHLLMSLLQVATSGAIQLQGIKASTQQTLSYAGAGMVGLFRPSGFLSHPNALADFLVLLMPALVAFVLLGRRAVGRSFLPMLALLGAAGVMLVLTLSRGGWIAFALAGLCVLWLGYRRGVVSLEHLKRVAVLGLIGVMLTLIVFPTVYLRLTESDNRSTKSRLLLAEQAVLIVERHPLLGVGLGNYTHAAQRNQPESFSSIEDEFRKMLGKGVVHNKYLLVAAETGLIGLLLFLNVLRLGFAALWQADFGPDRQRQALAIGLLAGLVAGLATFILEHANIGVPVETLWVLLGAASALGHGRPRRTLGARSTGLPGAGA